MKKVLEFKKKTFDVVAFAKKKLAEKHIQVGSYDFCYKCNIELMGWYLYCPKCGKKTKGQL